MRKSKRVLSVQLYGAWAAPQCALPQVVVRCRPLSRDEIKSGHQPVVVARLPEQQIQVPAASKHCCDIQRARLSSYVLLQVQQTGSSEAPREFTFDQVWYLTGQTLRAILVGWLVLLIIKRGAQVILRHRLLLQVYDWNSRQQDIYDATARPIVDAVLSGYNGTAT